MAGTTSLSPKGRVSFESVWKATSMEADQKKKFHITLLIPKKSEDPEQRALLKKMYDACNELCKKEFGCDLNGKYKGRAIRSPFRCGSEKSHLAGYDESVLILRFSSKGKPQVVNSRKLPIEEASGDFYNGCWARVSYSIFKYDKGGNIGIGLGLYNVQKVGDGEPFGSAHSSADDDFTELESDEFATVGDDNDPDGLPF